MGFVNIVYALADAKHAEIADDKGNLRNRLNPPVAVWV